MTKLGYGSLLSKEHSVINQSFIVDITSCRIFLFIVIESWLIFITFVAFCFAPIWYQSGHHPTQPQCLNKDLNERDYFELFVDILLCSPDWFCHLFPSPISSSDLKLLKTSPKERDKMKSSQSWISRSCLKAHNKYIL